MRKWTGFTMLSLSVAGGVAVFVGVYGPDVVRSANAVPAADPVRYAAHEWGTFTSIAGPDGRAIPWLPLQAPSDLPCFVHALNPNSPKNWIPAIAATVRMETPVIYFYSSRARVARVSVRFPRGLITEWYPDATVPQPSLRGPGPGLFDGESSVTWDDVSILPGGGETYPVEREASHYYAARETEASPVQVGSRREKFLFYRGLANFDVPVAATVSDDGRVTVATPAGVELPALILFEKRGTRMGYRLVDSVHGRLSLETPEFGRDFGELRRDLMRLLTAGGLYPREAGAMIESWRDSWFESGTRLFYIVPRAIVDSLLPLTVTPVPDEVARVFVGRLEVVTPAMKEDVADAARRRDFATLAGYGRTLDEIMRRIHDDPGLRLDRTVGGAAYSGVRALQPEARCTGLLRRLFRQPVRRY